MAAITPVVTRWPLPGGSHRHMLRHEGTGAANQADTMSTATAPTAGVHARLGSRRVLYVTCVYSAAPTQAGVTVTLDSGAGAGYDVVLSTGTANLQSTVFQPTTDLWIAGDDAIVVAAPAGGAGITAAILIVLEGT